MTDELGPQPESPTLGSDAGSAEPLRPILDVTLGRRKFLAVAGAAAAGLWLDACNFGSQTSQPTPSAGALKAGLAPGKYGGPTGFAGAERYQYELDSAEGRAIEGLRRLVKDGKVPNPLVIQISSGAVGHWTTPFPQGAPTAQQLLEQETGITLKFVQVANTDVYQKLLQESTLRSGSWHIGECFMKDKGDFAEAGLFLNLDKYVQQYKPDWTDNTYGYAGGQTTKQLFNDYNGSTYLVCLDGDFHCWFYRQDLFEDPQEKAAFESKYGQPLQFPKTWDDQAKVAAFFTRPGKPLYGCTDLKNRDWGYVNWMERYVSAANPDQFYFADNGSALIGGDAGVRALEEWIKSLEWTYPGSLSKSWPEQYGTMGAGQDAMTAAWPNMTKFIAAGSPLDKGFGKFLRPAIAPGRMVNGKLIRRPVLYFNTSYAVNAFTDSKYHEAAYLVLQWGGSARPFTWMVANPAGYYDPNRTWTLNDPLIQLSYQPYTAELVKDIIPHTAPTVTLRGANEYAQALDNELQNGLSRQKTAQQAMADAARAWDQITQRIGVAKQIAAIKAWRVAWPTIVDQT